AQGFLIAGKENIDIGEGFWMEDFIMDKLLTA
ncbi:MAG: GNAT family N-acetyltransferase, partial [Cytophaga sp.]|nr:GNAT family N-acetyltransferase [Cytophaga sp.]